MPRYSKGASEKVEKTMHEFKEGTLKSGSGEKVKSRKQAIAIGLSEAREEGEKVPENPNEEKKASTRKSTAKKTTTRSSTKKTPAKTAAKKRTTKKKSAA